jgi:hypothetical protein
MTEPRGLIGLGLAGQLAKRLGIPSRSADSAVTPAGTTQATAQAIGQFQFYVRASPVTTSAVGLILPSNAEVGSDYMVVNALTATLIVWPPTGGGQLLVNLGVTGTGVSIASGKGASFIAITASTFDAWLSG